MYQTHNNSNKMDIIMKTRNLMSGETTISKCLTRIVVKIETKLHQSGKTHFPIK